MAEEKFIVVPWPESQDLFGKEGFEDNCFLAPDDSFGSSAYFVSEDWYNQTFAKTSSENKKDFIRDIAERLLKTLLDQHEYKFIEEIVLPDMSENNGGDALFATHFYPDKELETIIVETSNNEEHTIDWFSTDDGFEIAKVLDTDDYVDPDDGGQDEEKPWDYGKHFD